jgi:HTH-type transcriptional regulator / antitoxin HigA
MKTTLIVIQNEADHADAKKLIEKLMGSSDSQDQAWMVAQARLVEAYERAQWPRTAPALPVLLTCADSVSALTPQQICWFRGAERATE